MRHSVSLVRQQGVNVAELMLTLVTLLFLNAIIIIPVARLGTWLFDVLN